MYFKKTDLLPTIKALRNGDLNLISYINDLCDRIEEFEPFIESLMPEENRRERLLKNAKELLLKFPDINNRPPLFGVAVGIKDIFRTDGFNTSCGSKLPVEIFDGKEAEIVTLLKNAGALILGKTITTEFAYFQPGKTKNPIDTDYTPGGSSSGSAAAVAAGFTPLSFGTQTIGSVSRPAAYCGIIGVKPSTGSISTEGIIPFSNTFDHVGFFTHDLSGAEYVASLFCSEWNKNSDDNTDFNIIGIPDDKYINQAESSILNQFNENILLLKNADFKMIKTSVFNNIEKINLLHKKLAAREFADTHKKWFSQFSDLYSYHSVQLFEEGIKVTDQEKNEILNFKVEQLKFIMKIESENGINAWISPSVLTLPPKGHVSTGSPLMNLPWTFIGVPTIVVPSSKSDLKFPVGLQFSGRINGLKNLFNIVKKIQSKLY